MAFKIPAIPQLSKKHVRKEVGTEDYGGIPLTDKASLVMQGTIGRGSYGKVTLCKKEGQPVIMKELLDDDDDHRRLFRKEATLLHSLSHVNIVGFDSIVTNPVDNRLAFLMEYVSFDLSPFGMESKVSSLKELLQSLDSGDFVGFEHLPEIIAKDICNGLSYLHGKDVVHRDLKPENILVSNTHYMTECKEDLIKYWLTKPVVAKLTDFGESRSSLIQTASLIHTRTDNVNRGSPVYMAPEIHRYDGNRKTLEQIKSMDVWSLAMTFFMLLNPNNKYPYESEINEATKAGIRGLNLMPCIFQKQILPSHSKKYAKLRGSVWRNVEEVYNFAARFDNRPSVHDIQEVFQSISERNTLQSTRERLSPTSAELGGMEEEAGNKEDNARNVREKAGTIEEQAGNKKDNASYVEEKAGTIEEQAGKNEGNASNVREKAGTIEGQAGYKEGNASNVREKTGTIEEEAGYKKGNASNVREKAGTIEGQAGYKEGNSSNVREKTGTIEEEASNKEGNASSVREKTGTIEDQDGNKEDNASNFREKTGTIEERSCTIKEQADLIDGLTKVATVFGDFHQASPHAFSHQAAGTQCTMNCLMAILKGIYKDPNQWTKNDINEVLIQGDKAHFSALRDNGWPEKRTELRLGVDELPDIVQCEIDYLPVQAEVCVSKECKYGLASNIATLIKSAVKKNPCHIIRMYGKCRAIIKSPTHNYMYFVFDPHSCGGNGEVDPEGAACLLKFKSLDALVQHFKTGENYSIDEQIDISPINVKLMPICIEEDENHDPDIVYAGTSSDCYKRGGKYRNTELDPVYWSECETYEVESLPYEIDRTVKFVLKCDEKDMMKISRDGRPWGKWFNSSRKNLFGIRRVARCQGSFKCFNPKCPFLESYGYENKVQFQRVSNMTLCFTCGVPADRIQCTAVKVWEYSRKDRELVVMHRGDHTCAPKKRKMTPKLDILKAIEGNLNTKPNKLVNDNLTNMMIGDFSWNEIENAAEELVDMKNLYNAREKLKKDMNPFGENFDALGIYKRKCDEKDPYYIYKMNNRSINGQPSFVFKASQDMAKLSIELDQNGDGILKNEYVYIDGKHDRTRGFKTITLWTYHPISRKLIWLAMMDAESESTESHILFWKTFNEMLQDYKKDSNYKFNPTGFVCDENHANWKSIEQVFGRNSTEKIVSCEFHFKQSVQRHSKKLDHDAETFITLANKILESLTVVEFDKNSNKLKDFVSEHPILEHWYSWWYQRKTHIFKAFKPENAPSSNLAEVGHAKLQTVGRQNMSLLEAAREDVVLAIRQKAELKLFEAGIAKGGNGPSQINRWGKRHRSGIKRAVSFAKELDSGVPVLPPKKKYIPNTGKHKPLEQKATNSDILRTFHLVFFHQVFLLKVCYGCGKSFKDRYKTPPNDLILKHFCYRSYRNKRGIITKTKEPTAAYFHLKLDCTRKVVPFMELDDILIHDEIKTHLTAEHKRVLEKFGINCL